VACARIGAAFRLAFHADMGRPGNRDRVSFPRRRHTLACPLRARIRQPSRPLADGSRPMRPRARWGFPWATRWHESNAPPSGRLTVCDWSPRFQLEASSASFYGDAAGRDSCHFQRRHVGNASRAFRRTWTLQPPAGDFSEWRWSTSPGTSNAGAYASQKRLFIS
jgi:hypothetical protein